jgi:hypothetical protein
MSVHVQISLSFLLSQRGRLTRTRLGLPCDALPDAITVDEKPHYLSAIVGSVAYYDDIQLLLD